MGIHRPEENDVRAESSVGGPAEQTDQIGLRPPRPYSPPVVKRLGTLAELTKGGTVGPDDGLGGAGGDGSV